MILRKKIKSSGIPTPLPNSTVTLPSKSTSRKSIRQANISAKTKQSDKHHLLRSSFSVNSLVAKFISNVKTNSWVSNFNILAKTFKIRGVYAKVNFDRDRKYPTEYVTASDGNFASSCACVASLYQGILNPIQLSSIFLFLKVVFSINSTSFKRKESKMLKFIKLEQITNNV